MPPHRPYMQKAPVPIAPAVPIPLVQSDPETGLQVAYRECACGCGEDVRVVRSPRLCTESVEECGKSKRDRRAQQVLAERRATINERVAQMLITSEKGRQSRVEAELQRMCAVERPNIEERLRDEDQEQFRRDAEAEERSRIMAELTAEAIA